MRWIGTNGVSGENGMSDTMLFIDSMREEMCRLRAENADLKASVIAFLGPYAVQYSKLHELDGLHPTHYDILKKCGARMVDFKRAAPQSE